MLAIFRIFLGLLLSTFAWADVDFLEPEQALKMSAQAVDSQTVHVRFEIADGYYLYKNKLKLAADPGVTIGETQFPAAVKHQDPQFGEVETYRHTLVLPVKVSATTRQFTLRVTAQGCADAGLCYPPITQTAQITLPAALPGAVPVIAASSVIGLPASEKSAANSNQAADDNVGQLLQGGNLLLILASFAGFGLLLALTPCVFPMMPIISGIIVGHGAKISKKRAFALSLTYVLGMALSYTLAGVAAGLSGTLISNALQNVWVLGTFSLVFVALSLSMFGVYELQLPASLQGKLSGSANQQKSGSLGGVFVMGAVSALIIGPCVAAPLAGALLYIAQTKDAVLGGMALFAMALGMGVPLIIVGVAAHSLPKAGAWMNAVKKIFGFMLLGMAISLVAPVLPALFSMLAWASLLIISAIFLHALEPLPQGSSAATRLGKGVGVMALVAGSALLLGVLAGGRDPLQPLAIFQAQAAQSTEAKHPKFERVKTLAELDALLRETKQPVMLDFYADWCVACKEMDKLTFSQAQVQDKMQAFRLVQIDLTANSEADQAVLKRFKLYGPPAILFFNAQGQPQTDLTRIGFQAADPFATHLAKVLASK